MMGKGYPQQALDLWSPIFVAADALAPAHERTPQPPKRRMSLDERFTAYDEAHPEIYKAFKRLATDLLLRGRQRYGAGAIFEVIRYERALQGGVEDDGFKLNNSMRSRFARKLVAEDPRFDGFFEFRTLRS